LLFVADQDGISTFTGCCCVQLTCQLALAAGALDGGSHRRLTPAANRS
jgi:hypothetical protein